MVRLQRADNTIEILRGSINFKCVTFTLHVFRTRIQRNRHQSIFADFRFFNDDQTLLAEHVSHRTGLAHVATMLGEDVPNFGDGAVLVVRDRLNHYCHSAGTKAFVGSVLVALSRQLASSFLNSPLDVFSRHVDTLSLLDDCSESRIAIWVTATNAGSHRDFFNDARENLATLGVCGALLVLDAVPL